MQQSNENTLQLTQTLGQIVKEVRETQTDLTLNRLANEYDIYKGTLSKIERGVHNSQLITLWKISEALGIKCSQLIMMLEERLGDDFKLIED